MPLYDYCCQACGDFRALRPMAESSAPQACPTCGKASERSIVAPFLGISQESLRSSNAGSGVPRFGHRCGSGCSHPVAR